MEQTEQQNQQIQQIIDRYQRGEHKAFGELYDLYANAVYSFVVYRVSNRQVAEDLTSDIFIKALEAMPRFDSTRASFRTWLYSIARNRIIDYYRTHKPTDDLESAATFPAASDLPAELETAQRREYIRKLLGQLPPDHRDLVIMRVWDELSYKEIAAITGQNENNMKVQFGRIVKKLTELAASNNS